MRPFLRIVVIGESGKTLERVQSVLVTACTSNGPMLSHTPPRYRKPSESAGTNNEPSNKEEFLHNGEKVISIFSAFNVSHLAVANDTVICDVAYIPGHPDFLLQAISRLPLEISPRENLYKSVFLDI